MQFTSIDHCSLPNSKHSSHDKLRTHTFSKLAPNYLDNLPALWLCHTVVTGSHYCCYAPHAPLVCCCCCCNWFDRGSRKVKHDRVNLITKDYDVTLHWWIGQWPYWACWTMKCHLQLFPEAWTKSLCILINTTCQLIYLLTECTLVIIGYWFKPWLIHLFWVMICHIGYELIILISGS